MSRELRVPLSRLEDTKAVRLESEGLGVCVVRIGSDVYAIGDRCSHADVSLSEGEIDPDARTVECWKHGSTFGLTDGHPRCLPATRPVPVFHVEQQGEDVIVRLP